MTNGAAVPWDTCAEEGCLGVRLGAGGGCLIHTPTEVLALALTFTGRGVDLDARGVTFTREAVAKLGELVPTDEAGRRLLGTVRLDRATFEHSVSFDETTFTGAASWRDVVFKHNARFGAAVFAAAADFGGSSIGGQAWFVGTTFAGPASFRGVTFTGPAWFREAAFAADAGFDGAVFSGDATLTAAAFSGVASFSGASFSGHARFDRCSALAGYRFDGTRFSLAGQGPPEAQQVAVPLVPPPVGDPQQRPPQRKGHRFAPSDGISLLIPLLAVIIIVAVGYVVFRPS